MELLVLSYILNNIPFGGGLGGLITEKEIPNINRETDFGNRNMIALMLDENSFWAKKFSRRS